MTVRGRGVDLDTMSVAEATAAASVALNATTSATGNVVLTLGPFTIDNPGAYYVEVFSPGLVKGTTNVDLELWEGTPGTGTLLSSLSGHLVASQSPCNLSARVQLAAGTHTLKIAGFVDAGAGSFNAGAGTTGAQPNAWARVRAA